MQVHEIEEVLEMNKESSTRSEVEMKTLPSSMKYGYLGANSTYPIIVNSELNGTDLDRFFNLVWKHRKAIGYAIDDIKRISPSIYTHRINLELDVTPSIEGQRRLNPNNKEVVKKEFLKLLDAGMIYPITNSKWVSPVQVVPKKGGVTVIENDKNELIPTRTVTG